MSSIWTLAGLFLFTSGALAQEQPSPGVHVAPGAADDTVAPQRQPPSDAGSVAPPAYRPPAYFPPAYPPAPYGYPVPPRTPHAPDEPTRRWYGWQTLIADGGSLLLLVAGATAENDSLLLLSLANYFLAPPIVHLTHGRVWPGLVSLGMRPVLPLLGAATGGALDGCRPGQVLCGGSGLAWGLLAGYAAVVAIDAAVLSWAPAEEEHAQLESRHRSFSWAPTLAAGSGSVGVGVAGLW